MFNKNKKIEIDCQNYYCISKSFLTMSETSSTYPILKICATFFQILINLGIGIYSAVILANNSKDMVPTEIYGFVMTICIFHFVMSPISACSAIQSKNKSTSLSNVIGLGLFIWSCVILFGQNGIDYKSTNPYYMVVFVYFLLCIISIWGCITDSTFCMLLYVLQALKRRK